MEKCIKAVVILAFTTSLDLYFFPVIMYVAKNIRRQKNGADHKN